ncbi:methyltransferase domain-containing protein [Nocardia farcinica]|uniref:hypothetical protein n=1 Tax=Nocardia farcinica TaxID=37329 RepID=UPI0018941125|nr:hypothetical protein [Nocardia farcinica]MBF6373901.1 hypothetical protein [Nocardia farcinica]
MTLRIDYQAPRYTTLSLTESEVRERLTQVWKRDRFPRLIDTDLNAGSRTDNPYWAIVRLMRHEPEAWGDPWAVDQFGDDTPLRRSMVQTYAWSIPSPADVQWMHRILGGRDVVEIGAGSGYWAWQLRQLGVDVDAVDDSSWTRPWAKQWSPVRKGGPKDAALHPDRALLLVWPPYDDAMAYRSLTAYEGDLVFYAGEGSYGCTADDQFHHELEKSWELVGTAPHHPTFDGIHCRLYAYRRNGSGVTA